MNRDEYDAALEKASTKSYFVVPIVLVLAGLFIAFDSVPWVQWVRGPLIVLVPVLYIARTWRCPGCGGALPNYMYRYSHPCKTCFPNGR